MERDHELSPQDRGIFRRSPQNLLWGPSQTGLTVTGKDSGQKDIF